MGFPSPADDYAQARLDLIERMVTHPSATFFFQADGNAMIRAGIHNGDTLVVDRSLTPRDGSVVLASIDEDFHVRQLRARDGKTTLVASDSRMKPIEVDGQDCQIWGVVTYSVHCLDAKP